MFEKPLGLRENPFLAGHHPKYLFPSREHQEALAHLRYGIQNREPFVLITGEVGTGKTTAVYDALAEWGSRAVVALITNSALSRAELLEEICLRFGVNLPSPVSKPQALVELQKQLTGVRGRGELAILLVDEAQNLDRELLEEIRLLSNLEVGGEYLLQIFLVGQPELENKLGQKELRQLRQRIGIHYRILPLSGTESARYIHHRVSVAGGNAEELFPGDTCAEIFRVTNGIPREINVVAGQSLLNAFVDDSRTVTVEHVRAVEREIEFQSVLTKRPEAAAAPALTAPAPAAPEPLATSAPPLRAVPPAEVTAEDEAEVEVSGAGADQLATLGEESLVDEYPAAGEPEPEPQAPARTETPLRRVEAETELVLPSWIDEIVQRRQAIEQRMLELASHGAAPAAHGAPPSTPPPPIPLPTIEAAGARAPIERSQPPDAMFPGRGLPGESEPSGAMLAAPPPERIAPLPAEPIPLFDPPRRAAEHLPPRLRNKLDEGEEPPPEKRRMMAWPIASVLLAALAIAVLLLVRFGPWTVQRRSAQSTAVPGAGAPADSGVRSSTPYPPFDRMNQPSGAFASRNARTVTQRAPAEPASPPPPDAAQTALGNPAGAPAGGAPTGGTRPDGAVAPAEPGAAPDSAATRPVPAAPPTYGISVGTYMSEARANAERTRISEVSRLVARVVTVSEDTVSMYVVMVGSYPNRTAAERAASDLVQRGVVNEARVVQQGGAAKP